MNKPLLMKLFLILFPMFALGLACMPDSVSVILEDEIYTCSFFGLLPDGSLPAGLALSGLLTGVAVVVATVFAGVKKTPWLTALLWVSLIAATMAVAPILLQTEPRVLPNVAVAMVLLVESLLAYFHKKQLLKDGTKRVTRKA